MKTSLILMLSLYSLSSLAQINPRLIERKSDSLFKSFDDNNAPGVAVMIVQDGKIAFEKGYGLASLEYGIKISPATVFDIASVSKQFTGYAISVLIQQGKISSDDDIHKYLPDLPDFGKKITIRNLVHHTSGLRDWPASLHAAGWRWDEDFRWDDIMRMVKYQQDLDFEPGSQYQYSNTGYNLLALIVEKVTGKTFPVWTDENIFKPLQMNSSQVLDNSSTVIKNLAGSYYPDGAKYRKASDMLTAWGSSSIFTTVEDLAKWVARLQRGWDEKDPVYMRMIETDKLNNNSTNNYAYGNEVTNDHGMVNINHTGGWASFATVISTYPEKKLSIILLSNNGSFNSYGGARDMAKAILGSNFKPDPGSAKTDYSHLPTIKVDTLILRKFTNTYKLGDGWYVTFTLEDGKLMVQATGEPKFITEPKSDSVIWVPGYSSAFTFRQIDSKAHIAYYHDISAPLIIPVKINPSTFSQYAGNYYSPELEVTYKVYIQNDKLMVHHMRLGDFELSPDFAMADLFSGNAGRMQFVKDSSGKITGFKLSAGRPKNIRFDRQK